MRNIYLQIPSEIKNLSDLVLATVTGTEGSTPQKPGSSALFNGKGLIAGTIGGGILEGKVQILAKEVILSKESQYCHFKLDNSVTYGEDALCGGRISILIDPLLSRHYSAFQSLKRSSESRIPGILVTVLTGASEKNVDVERYWMTKDDYTHIPPELLGFIKPEINILNSASDSYDFRAIRLTDRKEEFPGMMFLEPIVPSSRLIIAGAGHIGKALSQIGSMLDFEVTVIDDRQEFANSENIPHAAHIINEDIGKAIEKIRKGSDAYIVIVTRGHKDDGNALKACIGSDTAYIGMIGSRNKVALMHKEFISSGWATEEQWNKVYAPVGIEINSKTVEEIAVSIAAQLVKVKNSKKNG